MSRPWKDIKRKKTIMDVLLDDGRYPEEDTSRLSWDEYYIQMARQVATKSKDESIKVGVVIVGPDHEVRSTGFNGFPRGVNDNVASRHERPEKYKWTEHAERNAIYNAARMGTPLDKCTAYMESPPCTECARALIQAGITEVVVSRNNPFKDREDWGESIKFATDMLNAVGVVVIWTDF